MDDEQPQEPPVASESSLKLGISKEEDGAPIDPDTLRTDPDVAEELFGARYTGPNIVGPTQSGMHFTDTTTVGPTQFGTHNTMNNYIGEKPLDPIIGELPGVDGLLKVYAPADADEALDSLLAERSTVCLLGPRNSGRFTTARAALARR